MTTISSVKLNEADLGILFGSAARARVLGVFVTDPRRAYYQRQLDETTGLGLRAVQRELERFVSMGLLFRRSEGKRAYYQIDTEHPLFPELRALVLKAADTRGRLHGTLGLDASIRLAFLDGRGKRLLVVSDEIVSLPEEVSEQFEIVYMPTREFLSQLEHDPRSLDTYLREGEDLLGRREDIVWRRIEVAGFDVRKAKGVL